MMRITSLHLTTKSRLFPKWVEVVTSAVSLFTIIASQWIDGRWWWSARSHHALIDFLRTTNYSGDGTMAGDARQLFNRGGCPIKLEYRVLGPHSD